MNPRIELTDTAMSAMVKMAEGNPGALTAMMGILENHDSIDPQAMLGGLGAIMILDTWGIYGTDIYVLWNDQCGRDVRKMLMLMRAAQLGFFSSDKLAEIAHDQTRSMTLTDEEMNDLDKRVTDELPEFAKLEAA